MSLQYYCNCVSWPQRDVHAVGGLCDMIDDAIEISRRTFLQHVDRRSLADCEQSLSYCRHPSQGLTMAGDGHVSYHRSKLNGKRVYFFCHSAIEYVFTVMGMHPKDFDKYIADEYCRNESQYGYSCGRRDCPHCVKSVA